MLMNCCHCMTEGALDLAPSSARASGRTHRLHLVHVATGFQPHAPQPLHHALRVHPLKYAVPYTALGYWYMPTQLLRLASCQHAFGRMLGTKMLPGHGKLYVQECGRQEQNWENPARLGANTARASAAAIAAVVWHAGCNGGTSAQGRWSARIRFRGRRGSGRWRCST